MGRPNKYWPLIKRMENDRCVPLRTIVEEAPFDLFPEDVRAANPREKVVTMALNAIGGRIRSYQVKAVEAGLDSNGNPASLFYVWQLKLTFDRSYFGSEEYAELEALKAAHEHTEMKKAARKQQREKETKAEPPYLPRLILFAVLLLTLAYFLYNDSPRHSEQNAKNLGDIIRKYEESTTEPYIVETPKMEDFQYIPQGEGNERHHPIRVSVWAEVDHYPRPSGGGR